MEKIIFFGGSINAFAYLLNNYSCVSADKVKKLLSEIADGEPEISKGMIHNPGKEFSKKTETARKKVLIDFKKSGKDENEETEAVFNPQKEGQCCIMVNVRNWMIRCFLLSCFSVLYLVTEYNIVYGWFT